MNRVDLNKYDESSVVDRLKFLEYDMVEFLENRIDRKELEERFAFVVDKFDRMRRESLRAK